MADISLTTAGFKGTTIVVRPTSKEGRRFFKSTMGARAVAASIPASRMGEFLARLEADGLTYTERAA